MGTISRRIRLAGASLSFVVVMSWSDRADAGPHPGDTVRIGGEPQVAVVKIPVEDSKSRYGAEALFGPESPGAFPIIILLSGCSGVGGDADMVRGAGAARAAEVVAMLEVNSFTRRAVAEAGRDPDDRENLDAIACHVRDAQAARERAARRPEIDARKIFLQDHSQGAMVAIVMTAVTRSDLLGHHVACQEPAGLDAQKRALEMVGALIK